jgi:hypothetical protein
MIGTVIALLGYVVFGIFLTSISLLIFSLAGFIRLFPKFLSFLRIFLIGGLRLSFRLYKLTLTNLAPLLLPMEINIISGYTRLLSCIALSTLIGLLLLIITNFPISGWVLGVLILHGLLVGLAWNDFEDPDGIYLGRKIE